MPSLPNLDLHKSGDGVSILLSNHIRTFYILTYIHIEDSCFKLYKYFTILCFYCFIAIW